MAFHFLAVSFWIAALPIALTIRLLAKQFEDQERAILGNMTKVTKLIFISEFIVFLTGGYLAGSSWFDFGTPDMLWLALKQVIFFIGIIILSVILRNKMKSFNALLDDESSSIDDIRKENKAMLRIEHAIYAFLFLNFFLAVLKPF